MYSMVLMAALTTGSEVPDFGRRGGCRGGCYGGGYVSCGGGCYGGGGGCAGGWGGGYGCRGGGYGCWGGGCYGCCGGGYMGGGYMGGGGYSGGYYGGYAYAPSYPPVAYSSYYGPAVNYSVQAPGILPAAQQGSGPRPATLVVNLPADAKLTVDGTPTTSTTARRTFISPPLQPGSDYSYTLRAQIMRDGQTFSATQRVNVSPGRQTEVTLDIPTATTTASQ